MKFKKFYDNNGKVSIGIKLSPRDATDIGESLMAKLNPISYIVYVNEDTKRFNEDYNLVLVSPQNDESGIENLKSILEECLNPR